MSDGWACPPRSRKDHYFVGGTSLCGRWHFHGTLYPGAIDCDSCRECWKRVQATATAVTNAMTRKRSAPNAPR